jgi:ATP-dependent RNA helicase DbpA
MNFNDLALDAPLQRAIDVLGFTTMTPVQQQSLPSLLAGLDVIAQARTGSGKTAAFGIGLLSRIRTGNDVPIQALVLCPTRELADQVSTELRKLARFIANFRVITLCGGVPVRTQTPSLQTAPHVVVGTPGRILDHLERQTIDLRHVQVVVLDEADRMLDMGFADAIADVVAHTPVQRQTMLFSATFPDEVRTLSRSFQRDAEEVTVADAPDVQAIEQLFYDIGQSTKLDVLMALLDEHKPASALVFCHTRNDVREVSQQLKERGVATLALHGELEQRERDEVLVRFANGSISVLVATDVAARGLDIKGLAAVVAWELPTDADTHVHRIGRTGRAGQAGLALTLVSRRERERVAAIEAQLGAAVTWRTIDTTIKRPTPAPPTMIALMIEGGKQDKLRAGDLLGALTKDLAIPATAVGRIDIGAQRTYVAIARDHAERALKGLQTGKIKGRAFRVWLLRTA